MLSLTPITGASLPFKTLCLTFDDGPGHTDGDGPGPKTLRLAQYLHEQRIGGAFFVVGAFVNRYPLITAEVARLGHIIGNHTWHHPHMVPFFKKGGGDIVAEISRTTELIASSIVGNTVFFRAPYGEWDPLLSAHLNERLKSTYSYIGPVHWDISGDDYSFWDAGKSAEACASGYLAEITRINRGIVLMHDSTADNDKMKKNNRTYETIKLLVPELKRMGYNFVRLDQVPGIFPS